MSESSVKFQFRIYQYGTTYTKSKVDSGQIFDHVWSGTCRCVMANCTNRRQNGCDIIDDIKGANSYLCHIMSGKSNELHLKGNLCYIFLINNCDSAKNWSYVFFSVWHVITIGCNCYSDRMSVFSMITYLHILSNQRVNQGWIVLTLVHCFWLYLRVSIFIVCHIHSWASIQQM